MLILPISKRKYAPKVEIRNTYLVRIWYVLTLVRTKYVFASLNTPFGTHLVRICFSKYAFRILIAFSVFSLRIFFGLLKNMDLSHKAPFPPVLLPFK